LSNNKISALLLIVWYCDLATMFFIGYLWLNERYLSSQEIIMFSGSLLLVFLNMWLLMRSESRILENVSPGFIGLMVRKKQLETELRIKQLEQQIK